jgi:hypothetical protein
MSYKRSFKADRDAPSFLDISPVSPHTAPSYSRLNWTDTMPTLAVSINALLATVVTTIGAWLVWGPLSIGWSLVVACGILLFLLWRAATIGAVWAWSTLLLGVESLAWPVTTMVALRASSSQPSDEEMGMVLTAVLFGLFSSVFWTTFSFGLFKREQRGQESSSPDSPPASGTQNTRSRRHHRHS